MLRRYGTRPLISLRCTASTLSWVHNIHAECNGGVLGERIASSTDDSRIHWWHRQKRFGGRNSVPCRGVSSQASPSSTQEEPPLASHDQTSRSMEEEAAKPENELPEIEEFLTEEGYDQDGKKLLFSGNLSSFVKKLKTVSFSSLVLSLSLSPLFIYFQTNVSAGAAKAITFSGTIRLPLKDSRARYLIVSISITGILFSAGSTLLVRQATKYYVSRIWLHSCRTKITLETYSLTGRPKTFTASISDLAHGGNPLANLAIRQQGGDATQTRYYFVEATIKKTVMARLLGINPDTLDDNLNIRPIPPPPTQTPVSEVQHAADTSTLNGSSTSPTIAEPVLSTVPTSSTLPQQASAKGV